MGDQKTDRAGVPFQNDFTTNEDAHPPAREDGSAKLDTSGEEVDSQEADAKNADFARELRGTNINKPVEP